MSPSTLFLALGISWVTASWIRGVAYAAKRACPRSNGERWRWIGWAVALLALVVVTECALGMSGVLGRFEAMPPPMFAFVVGIFTLAFTVAYSRFGDLLVEHLPLSALVGFQAFRILAEAMIYAGVLEGIAPPQLSLEGYNFDIITGITAIPVAIYLRKRVDPVIARAWNLMGLLFLAIILFIATTSFPMPLRLFMNEPSNLWVTTFPYVLLPGLLVLAALTGHLLVFRKLKGLTDPERSSSTTRPPLRATA